MTDASSNRRLPVGLDNYGLFPLRLTPAATLEWAIAHGADGVAFSGLSAEDDAALDDASLDALSEAARSNGLYLEWGGAQHVPRDLVTWKPRDIAAVNRRAVAQASRLGARVVRSCSGGLMRWHDEAPGTETLLQETAAELRRQERLWRDAGVTLAIETHFEFTSYELVRLFGMCGATPGGWLGVCLDTMNLLTMLEDPVSAARRLLPWIVSTHIKDGGVALDAEGLITFPTPLGQGVIDLRAIVALVSSLDRTVHLSVEDHGGSFRLPVFDPSFLSRFPDLSASEFARLMELSVRTAAQPAAIPLAREAWPGCAERRMADDLAALRSLAAEPRALLPGVP
jgi:3-oxoisoapionate decarboxylase